MSNLVPSVVTCPQCAATWSTALFSSIDADTIAVQVDAILEDQFERKTCSGCGHSFRPEHPMLFASHARRFWVVMQPLPDRPHFAVLEHGVEKVVLDNIATAAPVINQQLRGLCPRLVFGQHMLTEAVRAAYAGVEASLLECAKLLTVRRQLPRLMALGPFELCFERFGDDGAPICAVHALPGGQRVDQLALPPDALAEAQRSQPELRARFPELFERPYVSATRYLLAATV